MPIVRVTLLNTRELREQVIAHGPDPLEPCGGRVGSEKHTKTKTKKYCPFTGALTPLKKRRYIWLQLALSTPSVWYSLLHYLDFLLLLESHRQKNIWQNFSRAQFKLFWKNELVLHKIQNKMQGTFTFMTSITIWIDNWGQKPKII